MEIELSSGINIICDASGSFDDRGRIRCRKRGNGTRGGTGGSVCTSVVDSYRTDDEKVGTTTECVARCRL